MIKKWVCALLAVFAMQAAIADAIHFVYPAGESALDPRTAFPVAVLKLALSKACAGCTVSPSDVVMLKERAFSELDSPTGTVNIVWSTTSIEREKAYLPVRVPIYRGLMGWRVPLVAADRQNALCAIRAKRDLHGKVFGQGLGWPDVRVLRANGFLVESPARYESLFSMLVAHRFDAFPRSVVEVAPELSRYGHLGVGADPCLIFHYPDAFYYFVSNRHPAMARTLAEGLEQSIRDGSYDALFKQYFDRDIERLHIEKRVVIELNNPLLPPATPLQRRSLWYRPCGSSFCN